MKKLLWGAFIVLVGVVLFWAYRRYALGVAATDMEWTRQGIVYRLLQPTWFGVLLITPLLLFILGRSLADLPWQQRILALLFRLGFLALIALGLGRLVRSEETRRICTVVLADVSDSVTDEALQDARKTIEATYRAKGEQDMVRLITFGKRPRLIEIEKDKELALPADLRHGKPGTANGPGAASDLAAALQLAYGVFPPGYLKRAIVLSDGVETEGDVLAEAGRARGFGVKLYATPYRRPPPPEVAVAGLRLPSKVDVGQTFNVTADIHASRASKVRARLYQGEALNGLDSVRELELKAGKNEIDFKSVVRVGGEVTYQLAVEPLGEDKFKDNNGYSATLDVPGRPSILYVEGQPQRATYLAGALGAQQFDVDVRNPAAFPASLKELERYDFVVLSDLPREAIDPAAQELVERYVRDLGGGFLFAGGEAGYGLGGWGNTTIERLLPVRMDAERRKEMPDVAMALIIDRSGSMTGLPMEMAKAACVATLGTLQGDDMIEVIAFDSTPQRFVKLQPARYRARIQNDVARIQPGGGTTIFSALDMGYQDLSVIQARKKHVVLLTDGQDPTPGMRDLVQAMLAEAITVTTVGLGEGVNHELLRGLADAGGGRYHHVPDPNNLPRIFTRETEIIAQQAAVEEWFPVEQVGSADFLKGIAVSAAPLLHGYVSTQMKPSPAQLILASDRGVPILARWRAGLGWSLAWTSDVKNHWAIDWIRWSGYGKFWGQLVREHMRIKRRRELDMRTEVSGSHVRATVDAFTPDERFDNGLVSKLVVAGAGEKGERREVPMKQIAPGRYEADFDLDRFGSFVLRAEHARKDEKGDLKPFAQSFGHVSNPYPREYASFEPDIERLRRAAIAGGGTLDPDPRTLFDPGSEKIVRYADLWHRFIIAAIALFLLDLLVRRVRIFDRKVVSRARRSSLPPPAR
ncbi:MAG TPA: VWA domain-containing protein [Polyangiaceae bacterium]|nr:VWA domain-containing protein [Polyangiaceae bacterium]